MSERGHRVRLRAPIKAPQARLPSRNCRRFTTGCTHWTVSLARHVEKRVTIATSLDGIRKVLSVQDSQWAFRRLDWSDV